MYCRNDILIKKYIFITCVISYKMLPLNLRIGLLSARSYSQIKFLVKRQTLLNKTVLNCTCISELVRGKRDASSIKPRVLKKNKHDINAGSELSTKIEKSEVVRIISDFNSRSEINDLCYEEGLDDVIIKNTKFSFQEYCSRVDELPTDLYIILSDLINGHGHILDLSPFFLQHAQKIYPHLKYRDELSSIGDLTDPANGYTVARGLGRKLYFHYGPTNSGKTHSALKRFMEAERGIYCSPIKLLAHEVFARTNHQNIDCDLITGDDIKKVHGPEKDANHVSCTVEMASVTDIYDVAVIDEIQMLRDPSRGAAWTRALLGIAAKEVHLCGEESTLNYLKVMAEKLGESLECFPHKRLTKLSLEEKAVGNFHNIIDGDCIICFSRRDIYRVMRELEKIGRKCAVVYGTLPPAVKATQTKKFNDPEDDCKTLVATDAVGLGINLDIRRIVFYRIEKKGEQTGLLSVSLARQIAGRAGRYGSSYKEGFVTSFWQHDYEKLKSLIMSEPEKVEKAGLIPSPEQIELFSYFLPGLHVSELLDIFSSLSRTDDSLYFMCDTFTIKRLAEQIKRIPLPVKTAYNICSAPVNVQSLLLLAVFTKFAKKLSKNEVVLCSFMKNVIGWPLKKPGNITELIYLEEAFDCLDLYLWFGTRFPVTFPESEEVKVLQAKIDKLILGGIADLLKLIQKENIGKDFEDDSTKENTGEDLIQKGILTPSLLSQLKKEWEVEQNEKLQKTSGRKKMMEKKKISRH